MKVVIAVLQWLATHQGWLLIYDNADNLALLAGFIPTSHVGAILLTTRLAQTQPLAAPLSVEPLDERVGAELLLHRARLLGQGQVLEDALARDQQAARQISHLVGGLPLALDQAGAYIDEIQCKVQDYLAFYQQDQQVRTRLLVRRGKGGVEHPEPVATTWGLAFTQVEQASPAAADLLRACAFLDPDLIPEELLKQGASFWSARLAQITEDAFQWNETLGELLKYALVKRSRDQQALSLHRLVQTVLRDALDGPTARQWAEHTVQAVAHVFPDGADVANWDTCKSLLPHAQRCAELIAQQELAFSEAADLLLNMANYLLSQALYVQAEPLYQRLLHICEQQLGSDHLQVAHSLYLLAILYSMQGKYAAAEPLYQRALAICEQQLGATHLATATCLGNLANLYSAQGKYAAAESLYQRALHIYEQQLGPDHPSQSSNL